MFVYFCMIPNFVLIIDLAMISGYLEQRSIRCYRTVQPSPFMALRYLEAVLNSWQRKVIGIIITTMLASKGILALKLPTRNVFGPSVLSLGYNSPLLLANLTWKKLRISEFLGTEIAKPCSLQFRIKVTKKERWDGHSPSKIASAQNNL